MLSVPLVDRIEAGIALSLGVLRPRPPSLVLMFMRSFEWVGMVLLLVMARLYLSGVACLSLLVCCCLFVGGVGGGVIVVVDGGVIVVVDAAAAIIFISANI